MASMFPDSSIWPLPLGLDEHNLDTPPPVPINPGYMFEGLTLDDHAGQAQPAYPYTHTDTRSYTSLSDSSVASAESIASAPRRRRRRTRQTPFRPPATEKRRYQCTFCTDSYKTRHDWKRHERTFHLSLDRWQCLRFGPVTVDASTGAMSCVFCGTRDPSPEHLETHAYAACASRPGEDRVFFRKDHLLQHLRLVHNGCRFNERMTAWVVAVDDVRSRCGFCDARMDSWAAREKHLADHFRSGKDMRDWTGDRGFDPDVEASVRDDMPAYMIAHQRETMDPFSASRADHRVQDDADDGNDITPETSVAAENPSAHSPRHAERVLLAYISAEIKQGRVPTDEQIRTKLGIVIYGPEYDEWEHTWADDPQWLEQLRKKAGLISLPLSQGKNAFVGLDALAVGDEGEARD
ncbi:hypothetical protein F5X68DRAFT_227974 [Plectosphaerella plurivora]|uniref:C2H2-type domain-containing protein n=1 Tax=Plectosphaerella plurivora TaxID=936078 RepID=A0A9P9AFF1_9PEZI|nr:hypothetical protein F5X68DRAFT_227974 [Plectosphaerella plurivora]